MKTENQLNEVFKTSCQNILNAEISSNFFESEIINNPNIYIFFTQLSTNYWNDLTSHLPYFFSYEDRLAITLLASEKFINFIKSDLNKSDPFKIKIQLEDCWKQVLLDFNKNNYWNFQQIIKKAHVEKTEEQKIFWKLFKYAWAFIQSMIILKIAVYYFGLESADHPDQTSVAWVWIFFILSVSSLVFFAYRNRHDKG